MSTADREEGLVPYGPSLGGISPLSVASHVHAIARPRRILAAPTYLESTSLALVYAPSVGRTRRLPCSQPRRLLHPLLLHLAAPRRARRLGLDLFMTRVAPAREFDRLNEDFNYVALVAATMGLIAATLGSGWYSNRKDLARAWK